MSSCAQPSPPALPSLLPTWVRRSSATASGVRQLVLAHKRAVASNRELRMVISSAGVLRVLAILGVDRELEIYPDLAAALAAGPAPDGQGYVPA